MDFETLIVIFVLNIFIIILKLFGQQTASHVQVFVNEHMFLFENGGLV